MSMSSLSTENDRNQLERIATRKGLTSFMFRVFQYIVQFYYLFAAFLLLNNASKNHLDIEMILLHWAARKLGRPCTRMCSSSISEKPKFETVFTFPYIKYFALFNRLKVYHMYGSGVAVPCCGLLEMFNVIAEQSCTTAAIIGLTGTAVLSLASLPFKNIIGFLYISEDNQHIKISSIDFWGKRQDKIIPAEDWVPILDMGQKITDVLYLSPHLSDKTHYKLCVKFGNVLNSKKMGEVLE